MQTEEQDCTRAPQLAVQHNIRHHIYTHNIYTYILYTIILQSTRPRTATVQSIRGIIVQDYSFITSHIILNYCNLISRRSFPCALKDQIEQKLKTLLAVNAYRSISADIHGPSRHDEINNEKNRKRQMAVLTPPPPASTR